MASSFEKVKTYLYELGYQIQSENSGEEIVIISDESNGISNMILDCEEDILIIEQFIMKNQKDNTNLYKRLLQMNRDFVHGAFVLDDNEERIIYRDTLQLKNLDLNELEASIKSLGLLLAEHAVEILDFAN